MAQPGIHPTAVVDPSARLGDGVSVGAFTLVGPDVEIGDGSTIGPHCSLQGPMRIGRENRHLHRQRREAMVGECRSQHANQVPVGIHAHAVHDDDRLARWLRRFGVERENA